MIRHYVLPILDVIAIPCGLAYRRHLDHRSGIGRNFQQVPEVREVGARTDTTVNNTRDFFIGKRPHFPV